MPSLLHSGGFGEFGELIDIDIYRETKKLKLPTLKYTVDVYGET